MTGKEPNDQAPKYRASARVRLSWPPPGYLVTCNVPGGKRDLRASAASGITVGHAERSVRTGRILVSVRAPDEPAGTATRWVAMSEIDTVAPAPLPPPTEPGGARRPAD